MGQSVPLLNQGLGAPVGTTQRPIISACDPIGVITSTAALPTIKTITENLAKPAQAADLTAANACFAFKLDRASMVGLSFHLVKDVDAGAQALIVAVTERHAQLSTGIAVSYQRRALAKVDLHSTVVASSASVDGAPGSGIDMHPVSDIQIISDYSLGDNARVWGEAANGLAELLVDFVGNGWIEVYGLCTKGTVGANNSAGIWVEHREL